MKNLINPYWSNSFRGKTLEEYICEYNNLLEKYKLKQTDNDEINFIDNEIRYIKQYIKPITENKITEAEELGEIDLIKLVIESDLSSYKKIISFLKSRKSELEGVSTLIEPINSLENSEFKFTNNFDNVPESKILEYFTEKLVETKYISEKDLILFLKLAFDKMEVPKQKISFARLNTQKGIIKIFYYYYKTIAGKPHGKQKKYLDLLCNYFNGFENFNIKNFSK
jgi:hypothetical protein